MTDMDWRPIASAPRDEDILVFSARWGALIASFSSEFRAWLPRMQCPVSLNAEADVVTHWMPMPMAPAGRLVAPARASRPGKGRPDKLRFAA
jgi:hypothetical protein